MSSNQTDPDIEAGGVSSIVDGCEIDTGGQGNELDTNFSAAVGGEDAENTSEAEDPLTRIEEGSTERTRESCAPAAVEDSQACQTPPRPNESLDRQPGTAISSNTDPLMSSRSKEGDTPNPGLDAPIIYTTTVSATDQRPSETTIHAELVDEEAVSRRIEAAEALGREAVLAEAVEAHVEPIRTDPGKHRRFTKVLQGRSPWFYFALGVLTVILVIAILVSIMVVGGGREKALESIGGNDEDNGSGDESSCPVNNDKPLSCARAAWLCEDSEMPVSIGFSEFDTTETFVDCEGVLSLASARWFRTFGGSDLVVCSLDTSFEDETELTVQIMSGGCGPPDTTCITPNPRVVEPFLEGGTCLVYSWNGGPGREFQIAITGTGFEGGEELEISVR